MVMCICGKTHFIFIFIAYFFFFDVHIFVVSLNITGIFSFYIFYN